jgi:hypothetical protein
MHSHPVPPVGGEAKKYPHPYEGTSKMSSLALIPGKVPFWYFRQGFLAKSESISGWVRGNWRLGRVNYAF